MNKKILIIGGVAENKIKGISTSINVKQFVEILDERTYILDIREHKELTPLFDNMIKESKHIPLSELRNRLNELPRNQKIYVYCQVGTRGYLAERILKQHGFDAVNIEGGYKSFLYQKK